MRGEPALTRLMREARCQTRYRVPEQSWHQPMIESLSVLTLRISLKTVKICSQYKQENLESVGNPPLHHGRFRSHPDSRVGGGSSGGEFDGRIKTQSSQQRHAQRSSPRDQFQFGVIACTMREGYSSKAQIYAECSNCPQTSIVQK